jgi:hypothetical protein
MSKLPRFIYAVLLAAFYTQSGAQGLAQSCPLHLKIELTPSSKELTIVLENKSSEDMQFFDSIRNTKRIPSFLGFSIKNNEHGIITKTDQFSSNYMSSLDRSSDGIRLPVTSGMTSIAANETISRRIDVSSLLYGTQSRWALQPSSLREFYIRFRVRVFCDENFARSVSHETNWYYFRDNKLLLDELPTPSAASNSSR